MRHRSRAPLAMLVAASALATIAATASAGTFLIAGSRFKLRYSALSFISGGTTVRCALTLEGSFSAGTFADARGTRIATVTSASVASCTGGSATVLSATLPWAFDYTSSTGAPPEIRTLTLPVVGMSLGIQPTGSLSCLMRSSSEHPVVLVAERESKGLLTSVRTDLAAEIPLEGSGGLCRFGGEMLLEGTSTSFTSPDEEEATVIVFYEGNDGPLIARGEVKLNDLSIPAGMEATLEMLNEALIRSATLGNNPTSDRPAVFIVENSGGRCIRGTVLPANRQPNACTIRIRTAAGTRAGTTGRIEIRYRLRLGWFEGTQAFNVIA